MREPRLLPIEQVQIAVAIPLGIASQFYCHTAIAIGLHDNAHHIMVATARLIFLETNWHPIYVERMYLMGHGHQMGNASHYRFQL